jgi:hypothetical protein
VPKNFPSFSTQKTPQIRRENFPSFSTQKTPQIPIQNRAIPAKLQDSANPNPKFYSFQQSKNLFFCLCSFCLYVSSGGSIDHYHSIERF